ncbi:hypothetical protein MM817_02898 [Acidibacillus sp. S0AB]|uniref:Uncharacterized protein n=2 Tax=Sulfoacidibacillus ferrooxidans TaxID=2005001 RepID=A0A9X2AFZ3_9BACL|nr:hypothetical protein [Sulfoacidibacillus ferrooxidans]
MNSTRKPAVALSVALNSQDVELLQSVAPGVAEIHIHEHNYYGGVKMSDQKTEVNIGSIQANQSAFAIGDNNTVTTTNHLGQQVKDATEALIEALKAHDIPQDTRKDLIGTVQTAAAQAREDKPNKTLIQILMTTVKTMVSAFEASPALITAYEAWAHALHPVCLT